MTLHLAVLGSSLSIMIIKRVIETDNLPDLLMVRGVPVTYLTHILNLGNDGRFYREHKSLDSVSSGN